MNYLIKAIRNYVNLSQQELADKLGVTFTTINRWENSKAIPNKLAQNKLYNFCKENHIPCCDMLIKKIQEDARAFKTTEDELILFHGSKNGIVGKIEPKSRKKCDFGEGFYMGTEPMQSLSLICEYENAKFYILSINLKELQCLDIQPDLDWAMIVAYNRRKMDSVKDTEIYIKYQNICSNKDIIIGSIADDRMFYVLDNFFQGNITDQALIRSLSALRLGRQYVAITQKGCDAIRIKKEIQLSYLEKRLLQDISEENRMKGISLADSICKDCRREGLFFDEIIDLTNGDQKK